ncbi:VWA domain-containing protein [Catenovulum sp. SM1970]|uniref:VIT domain-containing protein n=1 Tax=Marinifaba aquimaris TaxID=2741323 RepID=UPI001571E773|nr:VIT domain-containing protein [Marinifaba aquimaris]NTS76690.1 VWA domain-containing protein [Marinifaba aquimaris]
MRFSIAGYANKLEQLLNGLAKSTGYLASLHFSYILSISTVWASEYGALPTVELNNVQSAQLLFTPSHRQSNSHYYQAPNLAQTINIDIKGILATSSIEQTFINSTGLTQDAIYAFPLPHNAAINGFKIQIGNREIEGIVKEKQQAKAIFEQAKAEGKKAGLLTQVRPNLFTTRISNIEAGQSVKVRVSLLQKTSYQYNKKDEQGQFSLHFPLAFTKRYQSLSPLKLAPESSAPKLDEFLISDWFSIAQFTDKQDVTPFDSSINKTKTRLTVNLDAGTPLLNVTSPNHPVQLTEQAYGKYQVKLKPSNAQDDFELTWQYPAYQVPKMLNFTQNYQGEHYGLLMLLPAVAAKETAQQPRNLTFVLDTSGSMHGQALAQAKLSFKQALSSLSAQDSFQIIIFNSISAQLFNSPVLANDANKKLAIAHINNLTAEGGTEMAPALALAFMQANHHQQSQNLIEHNKVLNQVVFLTDGAISHEAALFNQIKQQLADNRLFTLGLGQAPNRYFMQKAAELGRGDALYIANANQLAEKTNRLFEKMSQPQLINLQFQFGQTDLNTVNFEHYPNPIPDTYAGSPISLTYKSSSPAIDGHLTGQLAMDNQASWQSESIDLSQNYSALFNEAVLDPKSVTSNSEHSKQTQQSIPLLAQIWARDKIAQLQTDLAISNHPQNSALLKKQVIDLALKYKLSSQFTSFVAVEKAEMTDSAPSTIQEAKLNQQMMAKTALKWQWQLLLTGLALFTLLLLACIWQTKELNREN